MRETTIHDDCAVMCVSSILMRGETGEAGLCKKMQKKVAVTVKRAKHLHIFEYKVGFLLLLFVWFGLACFFSLIVCTRHTSKTDSCSNAGVSFRCHRSIRLAAPV